MYQLNSQLTNQATRMCTTDLPKTTDQPREDKTISYVVLKYVQILPTSSNSHCIDEIF
jgi:hypothetical protein